MGSPAEVAGTEKKLPDEKPAKGAPDGTLQPDWGKPGVRTNGSDGVTDKTDANSAKGVAGPSDVNSGAVGITNSTAGKGYKSGGGTDIISAEQKGVTHNDGVLPVILPKELDDHRAEREAAARRREHEPPVQRPAYDDPTKFETPPVKPHRPDGSEYRGEGLKHNLEPKEVTVKPGDTIEAIAQRHLGPHASQKEIQQHAREIAELNLSGHENALILPGQKLKVPGHTADGSLVTTDNDGKKTVTPFAPPQADGRTVTRGPHGEKIEIDAQHTKTSTWPDGRVKVERADGTGFDRTPDRYGGYSEKHFGPKPSDVYEVKDPASERRALEKQAKQISDPFDRMRFQDNLRHFHERAQHDGLSPEEEARTYKETGRLLNGTSSAGLSHDQLVHLGQDVMEQAAHPNTVDQGQHKTCNVTAVESRLYTEQPSAPAHLVAEMALKGSYTASDGTKTSIDVQPHDESKWAKSDGNRSHASEIFQVTAISLHYAKENAKTDPPGQVRYEQKDVPANERGHDTGERLMDYGRQPPVELTIDGKPVRAPNLTDNEIGEVHNMIAGTPGENRALYSTDHYSVGEHSNFTTFHSEADMIEQLKQAKRDGKLPVVVGVDTNMQPFFDDSGAGTAGGSGGAHVVTVTDFKEGPPPEALVHNQWGSAANHERTSPVDVHQLYLSTMPPAEASTAMKSELDAARAAGHPNYAGEMDLLRLQKTTAQIDDRTYEQKVGQAITEMKQRSDSHTQTPEQQAKEKTMLDNLMGSAPLDSSARLLRQMREQGLAGDEHSFERKMETLGWRMKKDLQNGQAQNDPTAQSRYDRNQEEFRRTLQTLPEDEQRRILDYLSRFQ